MTTNVRRCVFLRPDEKCAIFERGNRPFEEINPSDLELYVIDAIKSQSVLIMTQDVYEGEDVKCTNGNTVTKQTSWNAGSIWTKRENR